MLFQLARQYTHNYLFTLLLSYRSDLLSPLLFSGGEEGWVMRLVGLSPCACLPLSWGTVFYLYVRTSSCITPNSCLQEEGIWNLDRWIVGRRTGDCWSLFWLILGILSCAMGWSLLKSVY